MPRTSKERDTQTTRMQSPCATTSQQCELRANRNCELRVDANVRSVFLYCDVRVGVSETFLNVDQLAAAFYINRRYFPKFYRTFRAGGSVIPAARPHKLSSHWAPPFACRLAAASRSFQRLNSAKPT